jgi:hypothetical protein
MKSAIAAMSVLSCYGCLAIGPSVGITVPKGQLTAGWEVAGFSFAYGQSFATRLRETQSVGPNARRDSTWIRRSYFVWEPRIGRFSHEISESGSSFLGGGTTIGMRWDRSGDLDKSTESGAVGGVWVGGGYAFPSGAGDTCDDVRPYVSIALGLRGNEIYLTPKAGIFPFLAPFCGRSTVNVSFR